jgi:hypothetical protein
LGIDIIKQPSKTTILKIVVFISIAVACFYQVSKLPSYPTGDGAEYVLVTEAFYKHKSPDIRAKDARSFKTSFIKHESWDKVIKPYVFDDFEKFLNTPGKEFAKPGDSNSGLYVAKNGKVYGYHFFTYSFINVPARYLMGILNKNPLSAFKLTNAFLILLTCFLILFYTPFNLLASCLIAFSFYYSSVFWYLGWIHPELFTVCLVTISLWFFFQNYYYVPLIIMSLAVTQNQPLVFVLAFMALLTILNKGFSLLNVIKIGFCCFIIGLPALFYYYNFETFSIINKAGFLDSQYQTFTRVFGFYFDLNQGVIIAIPVVLITYILIWFRKIQLALKNKQLPTKDFFLVFAIIAVGYTVSSMIVWNHGQSVINRYATWVSAIILIQCFFWIKEAMPKKQTIALSLIAISQVFTALYHEKISEDEMSCYKHKPIASWVLNNFPSLYNPDPHIFGIRTLHEFEVEEKTSPILYFNPDKELCKIMCHVNKMDDLQNFGISKDKIALLKKEKSAINNWVYINKGDIITSYSHEKIYTTGIYLQAKKVIIPKIESNAGWFNKVKENALTKGISLDSALMLDALYVLNLPEENGN